MYVWGKTYDVLVSLALEPLADAKLVLDGTEETGLLLGRLTTLVEDSKNLYIEWH